MSKLNLTRVEVSNFQRLRFALVEFDPKGGVYEVVGLNKAGKTTFLKAIMSALGGGRKVPDDPRTYEATDEEDSFVRAVLDNGVTIERQFFADGRSVLKARTEDGHELKQGDISEWITPHSFDPLAFYSLTDREQRNVLLSLSGDPSLPDKIEDLADRFVKAWDKRTPFISMIQKCDRMVRPEGERPDEISVAEASKKLDELQGQKALREEAIANLALAESNVKKAEEEIFRLEQLLSKEREALEIYQLDIRDTTESVEMYPDNRTEIEEVRTRIREAEAHNESLEPWREWDRGQDERRGAVEDRDRLTGTIEEIDKERTDLLTAADLPIDGLTFDEKGEPQLHGAPLTNASGRERVLLPAQIAIASNPEVRLCLIDEASGIDNDGIEDLIQFSKESGFLILVCRVTESGISTEIEVVDGEARNKAG